MHFELTSDNGLSNHGKEIHKSITIWLRNKDLNLPTIKSQQLVRGKFPKTRDLDELPSELRYGPVTLFSGHPVLTADNWP